MFHSVRSAACKHSSLEPQHDIHSGNASLTAQASISVILVLLYGYLARAYQLLSEEGERVCPFHLTSLRGAIHAMSAGS